MSARNRNFTCDREQHIDTAGAERGAVRQHYGRTGCVVLRKSAAVLVKGTHFHTSISRYHEGYNGKTHRILTWGGRVSRYLEFAPFSAFI